MNNPLPIYKGLAIEFNTGKRVKAYFLKHNPDAGETPAADDCFITVSESLDCGERGCGESGLFPPEQFHGQFKFILK